MLHKRDIQINRSSADYWRVSVNAPLLDESQSDHYPDPNDFRLLAENIPNLCWIARADGHIFWYNRRWHDYCGSTPQAMEGWGWTSVHHPDDLPKVMAEWQRSIEHAAPFEMIFPLRGADGVFRRFLTRIVPVKSDEGKVLRWIGTNTEVDSQLQAEAALESSEAKLRVLTDAMPQMVWSTLPDGYHDYYNARWYEFTGVPYGSTDGEEWNGMFHPDDQSRAWERWRHSLETGDPYEIEYRLRHHSGEYRWTLGRALPVYNAKGKIVRWIGTCTDIHEAKRNAEQTKLLSQELSHRIKNIFAVIGGLIGLSAPSEPSVARYAKQLAGRISALGRAHNFARPHGPMSMPESSFNSLHGLLEALMQPYVHGNHRPFSVNGGDVEVTDRSATPFALVFHELATNSVKYGALSVPEGLIDITITVEDDSISVIWTERGGPQIVAVPENQGFGSQLADAGITGQLSGELQRHWKPEGLVVEMRLPRSNL
ncbi:MAG: sensor histidine kinase [Sphingorhabdus sp.]